VIERVNPGYELPEREMLDVWLDYQRATLLVKCDGLDDDQMRIRSCEPSTMTLLGLVRHMTEVERNWFLRVADGQEAPPLYYSDADPDGDFDNVDTADVGDNLATFQSTIDDVRAVAARHSLDHTGSRRRDKDDPDGPADDVSLRWILVHMIEEYARHNGHADLLRERIDGVTGD
jgi:uncharacterized damage-inducible protein DinB